MLRNALPDVAPLQGGVNASIEVSTTFTGASHAGMVPSTSSTYIHIHIVMQPETLPAIFSGQLSPDNGAMVTHSLCAGGVTVHHHQRAVTFMRVRSRRR